MADDVSIHAYSREDATPANRNQTESDEFQSTRPRGRTRLGKNGSYSFT